MNPSIETLKETAYIALVNSAQAVRPIYTKAALDNRAVLCRLHKPKRRVIAGTRRIMVLFGVKACLSFDIVPPGNVNVLRYTPGEWETAIDEQYQRAVNIFGEPPEPWLSFFSRTDRSLEPSFFYMFFNALLWPFGLHVYATERGHQISFRYTAWRIFFLIISAIGITSLIIEEYYGSAPAVVVFGLLATFLGSLSHSLKKYKGYLSPSYIKSLKQKQKNVKKLFQLITQYSGETSLSNAQEVLTLSTQERRKLQKQKHFFPKYEIRLTRLYEMILLWAKIWAALCLASPEERSQILFEEILIHPGHHRYIAKMAFLHDIKRADINLNDPITWVHPIARAADVYCEKVDKALKTG